MLETVKQRINYIINSDFDNYFNEYLTKVQDFNIDTELDYLKSHNRLNPMKIDNLIADNYNKAVTIQK